MSDFVVYIIDDDFDVLDSIATLLVTSGYQVKTFNHVPMFLESEEVTAPGCILMDLVMPDITGHEALDLFKEEDLQMPVITMSAHANIEQAVAAMKQGASDHLEKPFTKEKCITAIEETKAAFNRNEIDSNDERLDYLSLFESLTPRERQVFHLIAEGQSGKQIANSMSISYRTMEKHKASVLNKLGISNSIDVVHILYKIKDQSEFKISIGSS